MTNITRVILAADSTQIRRAKGDVDQLQGAGENANRTFGMLKAAVFAVGGSMVVRQLVSYTDRWTDLNARLINATGSSGDAAIALARLSETARITYSSIEQTSEAFLRNATSLTELGYSMERQIDLTDALNNGLVVSGTKGQQAESVMNALSRAFAAGELRGQNFNTVIENGDRIVKALADGLGVGTLELRAMAEAGELKTGRVIDALTSQMETLREEAERMPATIGDGFVLLGNAMFETAGRMDEVLGASAAVSESLVSLADVISGITTSDALPIWGAMILDVLHGIRVALKGVELGFSVVGNSVMIFVTQAAKGWNMLLEELVGGMVWLTEQANKLPNVNIPTGGLETFREGLRAGTDELQFMSDTAFEAVQDVAAALHDLAMQEMPGKALLDRYVQGIEESVTGSAKAARTMAEATESAADAAKRLKIEQKDILDYYNEMNRELEEIRQKQEQPGKVIESLEEELKLMRMTNVERREYLALLQAGEYATAEEIERIRELAAALGESTDQMTTFAEQAARNMQTAFADYLYDPFKDGLGGMLSAFTDTLRRMAAEAASQAILGALFGGMSGSSNSLVASLGGMFGGAREMGGPVSSGKSYLVGERGPELFTPASSGAITANDKMGGQTFNVSMSFPGVGNADEARKAASTSARELQRLMAASGRYA